MTEFTPPIPQSEDNISTVSSFSQESGQETSIEEHLKIFSGRLREATTELLGHTNGEVIYGNAQSLLEHRGTPYENKQVNQQYDAIIGLLGVSTESTTEQKARAIANLLGLVDSAVKQTLNPPLEPSTIVDAIPPSQE